MQKFSETRRKINDYCENSGKYSPDAYEFVTNSVIQQVNALETPRHLTAFELLQGMNQQLHNEFGFLTAEVLKSWQIKTASDIGEIVFDLIGLNILSASEDDRREDFDIDFDLYSTAEPEKRTCTMEIPKID